MSSDAPLSDPERPSAPAPSEPTPPPAPSGARGLTALLRTVFVPFAPGRLAYGLAWLSVLALVATVVTFWSVEGNVMLALQIVLWVVGVVAAASLHLAAVSLNRRRDVGFSVFAACLVVLFVVPLGLLVTTVATATSIRSVISEISDRFEPGGGPDISPPNEPIPMPQPAASTAVKCVAPDGSTIDVDPQFCIDGHYYP